MDRHADGEVHSVSALKDPVLGRNLINKHPVVQTIKIREGGGAWVVFLTGAGFVSKGHSLRNPRTTAKSFSKDKKIEGLLYDNTVIQVSKGRHRRALLTELPCKLEVQKSCVLLDLHSRKNKTTTKTLFTGFIWQISYRV